MGMGRAAHLRNEIEGFSNNVKGLLVERGASLTSPGRGKRKAPSFFFKKKGVRRKKKKSVPWESGGKGKGPRGKAIGEKGEGGS